MTDVPWQFLLFSILVFRHIVCRGMPYRFCQANFETRPIGPSSDPSRTLHGPPYQVVWRLVSGLLTAWDTMLSATGFSCISLANWEYLIISYECLNMLMFFDVFCVLPFWYLLINLQWRMTLILCRGMFALGFWEGVAARAALHVYTLATFATLPILVQRVRLTLELLFHVVLTWPAGDNAQLCASAVDAMQ